MAGTGGGSFFSKYGQPTAVKVSKKLSAKDVLKLNISKQNALLEGKVIKGQKGNPIKSWFKNGAFTPNIGIYNLFGDKAIPYEIGKEKALLDDFTKSVENGEFDKLISAIAAKRK